MKWFHKIGLRLIDMLILAVALVIVTSSAVAAGDFRLLSLDFVALLIITCVTYIGVVAFVAVLTMSIPDSGAFSRFTKVAIGGLLVFFLYPFALNFLMFLLGYQLATNVQMVLMAVAILRTMIGVLLGRRWHTSG